MFNEYSIAVHTWYDGYYASISFYEVRSKGLEFKFLGKKRVWTRIEFLSNFKEKKKSI